VTDRNHGNLAAKKELFVSLDGLNIEQLLAEWRWLVPETMKPLWLNSFGDWMLEAPDGQIHFLDLLEGAFNCIAPSKRILHEMLQEEENRNRWLMAEWFQICNERRLFLARGQCYGWKVAPIIGGKLEFLNIQVFDIAVYECIMGQVHRQVQRLPEGATVTEFRLGDAAKRSS
jgi:hypothetical protein